MQFFGHSPALFPSRRATIAIVWALVVAIPIIAAQASSASADGCRTWLPDFDPDCDREGRPAGAVMPMSMPYLFEDPYITTSLNLVGIWHDTPDESLFSGGNIGDLALQARLAITDKLAFIATKDGYAWLRPDIETPTGVDILDDKSGFLNISVGFKYAFDQLLDEYGLIVTPAIRYEIPLGANDVFQGKGDGIFIPSGTIGWNVGDFHSLFGLGGQVPLDNEYNARSFFYNFHFDYAFPLPEGGFVTHIAPFIELNGIRYTGDGDGTQPVDTVLGTLPLTGAQNFLAANGLTDGQRFNGADVINLGSQGIDGKNVVTGAIGVRVPTRVGVSFGVSYEHVLTDWEDLFKQRITTMVTYEF